MSGSVFVRDIMSTDLLSVEEDARLSDVYDVMERKRIQHFPVLREGRLVGLLSERHMRDAMPSVLTLKDPQARRKALELTKVAQVCVRNPEFVSSDATVIEAIYKMRRLRAGSMPVVDDEKVVGIVTAGDLISLLERVLTGN